MTPSPPLTVFHVTHPKAGSQWVREILKHSAPERFVPAVLEMRHFYGAPVTPGSVYTALFVPKGDFDAVLYPTVGSLFGRPRTRGPVRARALIWNYVNFRLKKRRRKTFFVIRDLRDTLVSQYFSSRESHPILVEADAALRARLQSLGLEDGLLLTMEQPRFDLIARIQRTWCSDVECVVRYEELIENEREVFDRIIDHCEIRVDRARLHEMVGFNSFETRTGRRRGVEDPSQHLRKGIAGDWRNFFTERIRSVFKARYADLLVRTGYETNASWLALLGVVAGWPAAWWCQAFRMS